MLLLGLLHGCLGSRLRLLLRGLLLSGGVALLLLLRLVGLSLLLLCDLVLHLLLGHTLVHSNLLHLRRLWLSLRLLLLTRRRNHETGRGQLRQLLLIIFVFTSSALGALACHLAVLNFGSRLFHSFHRAHRAIQLSEVDLDLRRWLTSCLDGLACIGLLDT